jgi:hypothetical protein
MMGNHSKILYILVAVLFVALGFTFYQNEKLQLALRASSVTQPESSDPSTNAALADVVVGSTTPAALNIIGNVTQVGGNTLQIKDQTGAIDSVSVTANTKIQIAGALKTKAAFQNDIDAYNAQVKALLQDPVKNKAALAGIQMPSDQEITPGVFTDIAIGDQVLITASSIATDGTYVAALISKNTFVAPK